MEHRLGSRRSLRAAVLLYPRGASPVAAQIREVSISGMFVDAASHSFVANTVLDVELTLPAAAGLRTYRWQAMVIRTTATGIGLMFDRLRPPAITRLLAALDAGLSPVTVVGNVASLRPRDDKARPQL